VNAQYVFFADPNCTEITCAGCFVSVGQALSSPFAVDNRTGELYLTQSLDFEDRDSYQLTAVAGDMGVGSLPAYTRVNIRVLDENDSVPAVLVNALTESGRVEVTENAEVGAFAAYVAVRDADSGKNGASECRVAASSDSPATPPGICIQLFSK